MIPARMEEAEKPVMKRKESRKRAETAQAGIFPEETFPEETFLEDGLPCFRGKDFLLAA